MNETVNNENGIDRQRGRRGCLEKGFRMTGVIGLTITCGTVITIYDKGLRIEDNKAVTEKDIRRLREVERILVDRYGVILDWLSLNQMERKEYRLSGEEVETGRRLKTAEGILEMLFRYPPEFIRKIGLSRIKIVGNLRLDGKSIGGCYCNNTIYMDHTNSTLNVSPTYSMDHEIWHACFSSLSDQEKSQLVTGFRDLNPQGFKYGTEHSPPWGLEECMQKYPNVRDHFFEPYSLTSVNEDMAKIAEFVMAARIFLWEKPWLKTTLIKKSELIKRAMTNICPRMDENYWKDLRRILGGPDWEHYWNPKVNY